MYYEGLCIQAADQLDTYLPWQHYALTRSCETWSSVQQRKNRRSLRVLQVEWMAGGWSSCRNLVLGKLLKRSSLENSWDSSHEWDFLELWEPLSALGPRSLALSLTNLKCQSPKGPFPGYGKGRTRERHHWESSYPGPKTCKLSKSQEGPSEARRTWGTMALALATYPPTPYYMRKGSHLFVTTFNISVVLWWIYSCLSPESISRTWN